MFTRACQVIPEIASFAVDDGFTYGIPEGLDPVKSPSLSPMTNSTSKLFEWVLCEVITRMHGVGLGCFRHGRIFQTQVAGHTTVRSVQTRWTDLVYPMSRFKQVGSIFQILLDHTAVI